MKVQETPEFKSSRIAEEEITDHLNATQKRLYTRWTNEERDLYKNWDLEIYHLGTGRRINADVKVTMEGHTRRFCIPEKRPDGVALFIVRFFGETEIQAVWAKELPFEPDPIPETYKALNRFYLRPIDKVLREFR